MAGAPVRSIIGAVAGDHEPEDVQAHIEQLEQALESSRTIGAAIGILMATLGVDQVTAFAALKRTSQDDNIKLRELAAKMVAAGDIEALLKAPHPRHLPGPPDSLRR